MNRTILLILFLMGDLNRALSQVTAHPSSMGKIQVVTLKNQGLNTSVAVNTNSSEMPLKRSITFRKDGLISIVGNNSNVNSAAGTAQQVYTVIPFSSEMPKLLNQNENESVIQDSSGLRWRFNNKTSELIGIDGCEIQTGKMKSVSVEDPANLKLISCKGKLIVDYGTRSAKEVRLNMNKNAKITDGTGKSCSVPFSMLHRVVPKDEIENNFKSHEQFTKIVKNLCAGIDLKLHPNDKNMDLKNGGIEKDQEGFEATIRQLQEQANKEVTPAPPYRKSGSVK